MSKQEDAFYFDPDATHVDEELELRAPRVLVVDDDPALRRLYATLLREQGYDVDEAADGVDALSRACSATPDLIVSDLRMPRASGWDLLVSLRRHRGLRATPVVLLTADGEVADLAYDAELGVVAVVAKHELRGNDLTDLVGASLGGRLAKTVEVPPSVEQADVSSSMHLVAPRFALFKKLATPATVAAAERLVQSDTLQLAVLHSEAPIETDRVATELLGKGVILS